MTAIRDRIKGSLTALVTPFKNGKVDEDAFRALVDWQIAEDNLADCCASGRVIGLAQDPYVDRI